ncbi:aldo/keto reductase [Solibacillus sp. CAU 1738]|uniref:aldo/keto reductase n=1 Tax=Solibacillus sp. CAU 1738 TaxID=3140363 RepID=UPI0032600BDD
MKTRFLGNSSLKISKLSLGCMSLPTNLAEAGHILETALNIGINYFDTADLYERGFNEEIIGTLLKPHRKNIILATKVGNHWREGVDGWTWDASPTYIKHAVKESLRRLQTDYIDLYQLHGGTIEDNLDAVIDTFDELKKEGLIREYGISSIRPNVFVPFLENSQAISNMMQYNLLDRRAEEWFDCIVKNGASVVTRGSIAKGLLTSEWRQRLKPFMSYTEAELAKILTELEQQYGSLHALAFAFNLQHQAIASTVIGARTEQQLIENFNSYKQAQHVTSLHLATQMTKQEVYTEHR